MSDFKVGERVTTRRDLSLGINYGSNKQTFNLEITEGMLPFLGHTYEIERTSLQGNYRLKGCFGWWSDSMLDPAKVVEPEPKPIEGVTINILKGGALTEYHKYHDLKNGERFFWDTIMEYGRSHTDCQVEVNYYINGKIVNSIVMRPRDVQISI